MRDAPQQLERPWLARLLLDNYPLKLLAILLAVALFSLVHSDQDAQRSIYVDVVALLPLATTNQMLVSDLPTQVRVTLRGSRSRIAALQRDDFAPIQMDLRDPNRRHFYFDTAAIDVSGPVHVISVDPPSLDLIWAPRAERKVPVHARLRGIPEDGHTVKKPILVTPSSVTIQGPKDEVDAVAEVFTDEIPVDGLGKGVHERRAQLQPLKTGHVKYRDDPNVEAQIEIVPEYAERALRHVELAVLGAAEATLRPNVVTVTVNGPVKALAEIEQDEIVPYVDLSTMPVSAPFAAAEVKLRGVPDGFEVVKVSPASVLAKRGR
ncbi:MAG TPA: CdaR family protein [Polyangiales bacterium]|nr:CdaR family protein [Polyangiales bacterium]